MLEIRVSDVRIDGELDDDGAERVCLVADDVDVDLVDEDAARCLVGVEDVEELGEGDGVLRGGERDDKGGLPDEWDGRVGDDDRGSSD